MRRAKRALGKRIGTGSAYMARVAELAENPAYGTFQAAYLGAFDEDDESDGEGEEEEEESDVDDEETTHKVNVTLMKDYCSCNIDLRTVS